ncbi:MAG: metal-dependent hydrolase [Persicimonas sp.]
MYPIGHASLATLLAHRHATAEARPIAPHAELYPVIFGALLPDLVDKSILYLGVSPYGRTVGHSLLVLGLCAALWCFFRVRDAGGTRAFGWMLVGWASHFIGDLANDIVAGAHYTGYLFSGWMGWPYTNPDMWEWKVAPLVAQCSGCYTGLELVVVFGAMWWLWRK